MEGKTEQRVNEEGMGDMVKEREGGKREGGMRDENFMQYCYGIPQLMPIQLLLYQSQS